MFHCMFIRLSYRWTSELIANSLGELTLVDINIISLIAVSYFFVSTVNKQACIIVKQRILFKVEGRFFHTSVCQQAQLCVKCSDQ
jgi:hypothetical protein